MKSCLLKWSKIRFWHYARIFFAQIGDEKLCKVHAHMGIQAHTHTHAHIPILQTKANYSGCIEQLLIMMMVTMMNRVLFRPSVNLTYTFMPREYDWNTKIDILYNCTSEQLGQNRAKSKIWEEKPEFVSLREKNCTVAISSSNTYTL